MAILPVATNANEVIEQHLDTCASRLEELCKADVVAICGGFDLGIDDVIRTVIEGRIEKRAEERKTLAVVLETPGGYVEVVQRVADTFRHHYDHVEFIIPNYALSAGTVLVLSGDRIHMDYFSILGPIDPQLPKPDGTMIPALGYLEQYKRLVKKSQESGLSPAEIAFLVEKFDPAELYAYEQQRELAISLIEEWLAKYKFKDWQTTETTGKPVTPSMRSERAKEIATILNDTNRWHSHGRGIPMSVLRKDLNLKIEDFGEDQELNRAIRGYHQLLMDYWTKTGHQGFVHTKGRWVHLHR